MYHMVSKIINNSKVICIFDCIYLGVISLNSFIWLYFSKKTTDKISYVIFFAALFYMLTQLAITLIYKAKKEKQRHILYKNKRIFKCIYMLIYMTAIMMNILANKEFLNYKFLIYNLTVFVYVYFSCTSFYWFPRLKSKVNRFIKEHKRNS